MTEKAEQIMNRIREKDRTRRIFARLKDPRLRSTTMEQVNRMDQDEPARVGGGDQETKVLKEMNELQEFENDNWNCGPRDFGPLVGVEGPWHVCLILAFPFRIIPPYCCSSCL